MMTPLHKIMAINNQELAAEDYADARARMELPHAKAIVSYIITNQTWAAEYAHRARRMMGVYEEDQFYA